MINDVINGIPVGYPQPGYQGGPPPPPPQVFVTQAPPAQQPPQGQGGKAATGCMAGWYVLS